MATLHLPKKNRQSGKNESLEDKAERKLDEGLKETFPASDPVAATAPGRPAAPEENPARQRESERKAASRRR